MAWRPFEVRKLAEKINLLNWLGYRTAIYPEPTIQFDLINGMLTRYLNSLTPKRLEEIECFNTNMLALLPVLT